MSPADADCGRLLCQALVGDVDPSDFAALSDVGWEELLTLARDGRVDALLAHRLRDVPMPERVPERVAERLDARRRRVAFAWLYADTERRRLSKQLAPVARTVVLKGHALAPLIYPDPALRSTNDIDLLVAKDRSDAVISALQAMGYVETDLFPRRPASRATYHERVLSREVVPGRVRQPVEVHTGFAQSFRHRIPYGALLDRAVPLDDTGAYRLDDVDQLLHLAVHAAREQFLGPLKQLLDVHLWVVHLETEGRLDWDEVLRRALAYGLATSLWETLRLTRALFGTALPREVTLALRPGPLRRLWLERWHVPDAHHRTCRPASMRTAQALALFPLLDSSGDRARFAWRYAQLRAADVLNRD